MLRCQQSEGSLGSDLRPDAIQAKSDPRSWRRAIPVMARRRFRRPRFGGDFSMRYACPRRIPQHCCYRAAASYMASAGTTRLIWVMGCVRRETGKE
jgi:hypothetical protein